MKRLIMEMSGMYSADSNSHELQADTLRTTKG